MSDEDLKAEIDAMYPVEESAHHGVAGEDVGVSDEDLARDIQD